MKWLQIKCTGKDVRPRLQRWLVQLGEYNMRVNYIKDKLNKLADFLSRINSKTNEINNLTENKENNSLLVQTVHSQEDLNDHIASLDTVVNRFKTQAILADKKILTCRKSLEKTNIH